MGKITDKLMAVELKKELDRMRLERRYKCLVIDERLILTILNFHRGKYQFYSLPVGGEIPADAVVEAVQYSVEHCGFLLRVWSSEFPIVPDGQVAPMMYPPFEVGNLRENAIIPLEGGLGEAVDALKRVFQQKHWEDMESLGLVVRAKGQVEFPISSGGSILSVQYESGYFAAEAKAGYEIGDRLKLATSEGKPHVIPQESKPKQAESDFFFKE